MFAKLTINTWTQKSFAQKHTEVSDRSYEEILDAHREWNRKHKYPHTDAFQYLYPIPKMKNLPQIKWCFLAGVASPQQQQYRRPDAANIRATYDRKPHEANCSTTPASKHLSHQLQIVMRILQLKMNYTTKQESEGVGSSEEWMMFSEKSSFDKTI